MASLNASPEYYNAEGRYSEAKTSEEKLDALQEMLKLAPKHKAAHALLSEIKKKIARLRKEKVRDEIKAKQRKSSAGDFVKKQGVQIALLGWPNAGKTALLNALCGLSLPSTSTPFETAKPQPGAWVYEKVQIQVLDLPSATDDNKARIYALARPADLAVVIVGPDQNVEAQEAFFKDLRNEKILFCISKSGKREGFYSYDVHSLDALKRKAFDSLEVIRVFTKTPKEKPDMEHPIVLFKRKRTVLDAAKEIHKDFASLKYARVWGSAKFAGQQVSGDYELQDNDVIELHLK